MIAAVLTMNGNDADYEELKTRDTVSVTTKNGNPDIGHGPVFNSALVSVFKM